MATLTQGTKTSAGTVNYNTDTGAKLSAGQTVNVSGNNTSGLNPGSINTTDKMIAPSDMPGYGGNSRKIVNPNYVDPATAPGIDATQPNPTNITAGQGLPGSNTAVQPGAIPGAMNGAGTIQNIQPPTSAQQTLANAKASGTGVPQNAGEAKSAIASFTPPKPPDTSNIDQQLAEDKGYQQILADQAEYNHVANQQKSLTDTYNDLINQAGIPAINTELLNTQRIINGTEDDIRKEVQAVSGFATDSQILALSSARNKTLIANYNNLLDTKKMAMDNVQTMIGLAKEDHETALTNITNKMNMDQKVMDYRDKFVNNAKEGYNNVIKAQGYAGLYSSLAKSGDPTAIGLAEKTLGLAPGQLKQMASFVSPTDKLELENKQLTNQKLRNEVANPVGKTQVVDVNGKKLLVDSKTGATIKEIGADNTTGSNQQQVAQQQGNIQQIDALKNDKGLYGSVGPNVLARSSLDFDEVTGVRSNFIAGVQQLTNQLTLDALQNAKHNGATFGALSEGELNLLSSSATKLNSWAQKDKNGNVTGYNTTEKNFKAELDKISNYAKLDYILKGGDPTQVGVQTMLDGTHWVQNSDGSMTKI